MVHNFSLQCSNAITLHTVLLLILSNDSRMWCWTVCFSSMQRDPWFVWAIIEPVGRKWRNAQSTQTHVHTPAQFSTSKASSRDEWFAGSVALADWWHLKDPCSLFHSVNLFLCVWLVSTGRTWTGVGAGAQWCWWLLDVSDHRLVKSSQCLTLAVTSTRG